MAIRYNNNDSIPFPNRICLLPLLELYSAIKICILFLARWETITGLVLTLGTTLILYYSANSSQASYSKGVNLPWMVLSYTHIITLTQLVRMRFRRREHALRQMELFRMRAFQLYMAHATWDWSLGKGRQTSVTDSETFWLRHSDDALSLLLQMGEDLERFLTLPTYSGTRHMVYSKYRKEATRTITVAHRLLLSCISEHMTQFTLLCEVLKRYGLDLPEAIRIRRWESMITRAIEELRLIKTYRTPNALQNFGRLFSIFLPPLFAPYFVQLAYETSSLGLGMIGAALVSFTLTSLFECSKALEDPFLMDENNRFLFSFDAVDVQREFQLYRDELIGVRKTIFPSATGMTFNNSTIKKQE